MLGDGGARDMGGDGREGVGGARQEEVLVLHAGALQQREVAAGELGEVVVQVDLRGGSSSSRAQPGAWQALQVCCFWPWGTAKFLALPEGCRKRGDVHRAGR